MRCKDAAKIAQRYRKDAKNEEKVAKMASSTLRVYNIYIRSVDEAIFAAFY